MSAGEQDFAWRSFDVGAGSNLLLLLLLWLVSFGVAEKIIGEMVRSWDDMFLTVMEHGCVVVHQEWLKERRSVVDEDAEALLLMRLA